MGEWDDDRRDRAAPDAPRDTRDLQGDDADERQPLVSSPSAPAPLSGDIPDETDDAVDAPTIVSPRRGFATNPASRPSEPHGGPFSHNDATVVDSVPTAMSPRVPRPGSTGGRIPPGVAQSGERRFPYRAGAGARPSAGNTPSGYTGPARVARGWQPSVVRQEPGMRQARQTPPIAPFESSTSWGPTTIVITANTAAGFSYLFWWVSGLLVYFNERRNRYVRFHAVQSIMLMGALSIFSVLAYIVAALFNDLFVNTHQGIFQTLSQGTIALAVLIVVLPWLTAMIAAWSGTYLRLPIVGEYAERYAAPAIEPRPGSHA